MNSVLFRRVLPPVLLGVLALVAWQLVVQLAGIQPYLLPAPLAIWTQVQPPPWM